MILQESQNLNPDLNQILQMNPVSFVKQVALVKIQKAWWSKMGNVGQFLRENIKYFNISENKLKSIETGDGALHQSQLWG